LQWCIIISTIQLALVLVTSSSVNDFNVTIQNRPPREGLIARRADKTGGDVEMTLQVIFIDLF
jgi:hypothetical protein